MPKSELGSRATFTTRWDRYQILRIAEEAVSNAVANGRAGRVTIEMQYRDDGFSLCVRDDGAGFNTSSAWTGPGKTKDASSEKLLEAIRRVAIGLSFVPPETAEKLAMCNPNEVLRPREREVLQHLFKGESNQESADALGISEGTVRIHVSNVFHKLGVARRTEAISVALKRGLIRFE